MTPQVRIWVVTDDFDPRGIPEAEDAPFLPEPRRPAERECLSEHIVLGYN
jgi:hypothetical protein